MTNALTKHLLFSKVGTMSTTTLDQEIDIAEAQYGMFRNRLRMLISTLKGYHEAMVKMNESQSMVSSFPTLLRHCLVKPSRVLIFAHFNKRQHSSSRIRQQKHCATS